MRGNFIERYSIQHTRKTQCCAWRSTLPKTCAYHTTANVHDYLYSAYLRNPSHLCFGALMLDRASADVEELDHDVGFPVLRKAHTLEDRDMEESRHGSPVLPRDASKQRRVYKKLPLRSDEKYLKRLLCTPSATKKRATEHRRLGRRRHPFLLIFPSDEAATVKRSKLPRENHMSCQRSRVGYTMRSRGFPDTTALPGNGSREPVRNH